MKRRIVQVVAAVVMVLVMGSCSQVDATPETFNRAWDGVSATMTTYNQAGVMIDRVHGASVQVSPDERFDLSNNDGGLRRDSAVLLISIGDHHVSHVGSSMVLAQDGLEDVMTATNTQVRLDNNDRGTPWINNLIEKNRNLWAGKEKTLMVRSQDGSPIAVYACSKVEVFATDVKKATMFRVDGKYLFVYSSDYTVYDTALLGG